MRKDWIEIELNQVCDKAKKVKRNDMPSDETFIYLDIGGIDNHSNRIIDHKIYQWREAPSRAQQIVQLGDVLFSTVRTYLKNIAQVSNPKYQGQICSSGFTVIRGKKGILNPKYVFYYSIFEGFLQPLNELQTGTSYPAVRDNDVFAQKIPIAPLPEQRAIVAKIEQLFSELDNGITNLKAARGKLEIYRQAVLKKAFDGELTYSTDSIEIVPFGDEIKIVSGSTPKGINDIESSGSIPFFKVSDMNHEGNEVEMRASNLFIDEAIIKELKIKIYPKGTVIFPKRGGAILTNKKRILGQDSAFDLNLMGVLASEDYLSKYLYYFFIHQDLGKICDGSAVPQINNKNIAPLDFPKCNIEHQRKIISEIESRLSVCDNILANIEEGLEKSEALRQSILKQAFEGKLLSEEELEVCRKEPDWEPAEKLLERVKTEKTTVANFATHRES
jgi:type I restriction enzyme S subunit